MSARHGVDPRCRSLAWHFLTETRADEPPTPEAIERNVTSLSEAIQSAVEDWFAAQNWEPR